jgi:hypothetical protein
MAEITTHFLDDAPHRPTIGWWEFDEIAPDMAGVYVGLWYMNPIKPRLGKSIRCLDQKRRLTFEKTSAL